MYLHKINEEVEMMERFSGYLSYSLFQYAAAHESAAASAMLRNAEAHVAIMEDSLANIRKQLNVARSQIELDRRIERAI